MCVYIDRSLHVYIRYNRGWFNIYRFDPRGTSFDWETKCSSRYDTSSVYVIFTSEFLRNPFYSPTFNSFFVVEILWTWLSIFRDVLDLRLDFRIWGGPWVPLSTLIRRFLMSSELTEGWGWVLSGFVDGVVKWRFLTGKTRQFIL